MCVSENVDILQLPNLRCDRNLQKYRDYIHLLWLVLICFLPVFAEKRCCWRSKVEMQSNSVRRGHVAMQSGSQPWARYRVWEATEVLVRSISAVFAELSAIKTCYKDRLSTLVSNASKQLVATSCCKGSKFISPSRGETKNVVWLVPWLFFGCGCLAVCNQPVACRSMQWLVWPKTTWRQQNHPKSQNHLHAWAHINVQRSVPALCLDPYNMIIARLYGQPVLVHWYLALTWTVAINNLVVHF